MMKSIKGGHEQLAWILLYAFRYAVNRHFTQAMWGIDGVILSNIDLLSDEFVRQMIGDIEREQRTSIAKEEAKEKGNEHNNL